MQDKAKILYQTLANLVVELRTKDDKTYLDFCDENSIPTSTYDNIVNGKTQVSFYNVSKVVRGLNLNFKDFGELLDSKLPLEYWEDD